MASISGINSLSSSQIRAINRLQELGTAIATNSQRLSTFKRINSAKDDPAGLVAATSLQRELTAAETASKNVTRASAIVSTADSSIGQIVDQLQEARTLILQSAGGGQTAAEVAANQIEVDVIINNINSLSQVEFGGKRLLDGSSSFRAQGVDTTEYSSVNVLSKTTADDVTVNVEVTTQATQATDTFSGTIAADTTFTIEGPEGSAVVSLSNGATDADITTAINSVAYLTGVDAVENGGNVDLATGDYGTAAEITITVSEGAFTTDVGNSADGTDAVATINGESVTGDGTKFNVSTSNTQLEITVDPTANGTLTSFVASGEGLVFTTGTNVASALRIGMPNLNAARLGGASGKVSDILSGNDADLIGGNSLTALRVIDDAISQATLSQATVGAFNKNALGSASRVLNSQTTNLTSALSAIQDTNVAVETALLTNNQLMQQATLQALSISSLQDQSVLSLLQSTAIRF